MNKNILIVDDDKKIAALIDFRLKKRGYNTESVFCGEEAIHYVREERPVLVLLDIRLPDKDGIEVLKEIRKIDPQLNVIMISAHAEIKHAVECMKYGAYDFLEKPFNFPEMDAKIQRIFREMNLEEEVSHLRKELGEKYQFKNLLGRSPAMKKIFESIDIAAKSDVNVLLEGESGTGKELAARAIHFNGTKKNAPFIAVNCGAIPENLLESELFGYEKGAFTGAAGRKIGKFEQAQDGTVFLDEMADLSPALQVKLLRVLQEREIERVGGTELIAIRARFIAATNQDLKKLVRESKFREDLYFRIHVFPIRIPSLRERKEDIPLMIKHFIKKHGGGKRMITFSNDALNMLVEYSWPGNVRELENAVERLLLTHSDDKEITGETLLSIDLLNSLTPSSFLDRCAPGDLVDKRKAIEHAERKLLENALKDAGGNITKACKILEISRDTFYRKMKKYVPV
ncbi:MAG: sigma-54-dependent Fis family transcriptional regulator [Candidatus Omnitrophica bacterium]|nr:sigma-54-dependent Fis family transcriptional regulator [Candidatus Omnitrophota bacterium]